MLNTVALIGRLGADPEIRYTSSGIPVANFRIAVNEFWTGQNGEKQERTHWFSCIAWKSLAEVAEKYLSKGSQIGISGSLRQKTWQTDAGEPRSMVEIVVRNLTMLDRKKEEAPAVADDEIPF
jgi:single-strand DNA-binding protein